MVERFLFHLQFPLVAYFAYFFYSPPRVYNLLAAMGHPPPVQDLWVVGVGNVYSLLVSYATFALFKDSIPAHFKKVAYTDKESVSARAKRLCNDINGAVFYT
jgi:hypothetical protein